MADLREPEEIPREIVELVEGPDRRVPSDRADLCILLVEDSPADVVLTREALRDSRLRPTISVVGDGVEALAYLRREGRFADAAVADLVLLDLNLPRMGGREVLHELARDPRLREIPIVVLTTSRRAADIEAAHDARACTYIVKPLDLDEFTDAVRCIEDLWFARTAAADAGVAPVAVA